MKKFNLLITLIIILTSIGAGQNPNLGTAGAQFLKIPVSAHASAMGGAFIGMVDDATAFFWNPAGLAHVESNAAHFSYIRWFEMFDVNAASFIHNFGDVGILGAGILVFSTGEMEITTEKYPNGTDRFFDAQDIAIGISYAKHLTDKFRVGITAKYIHQRIWDETANGIAFDIGTQYEIDFQKLVIAMSMTNFGPDMKMDGPNLAVKYDGDQFLQNRLVPANYETEDYPLPLNFQFGLSFEIYRTDFFAFRGGIDAVHPNDNNERIQFGAEAGIFDQLFVRVGYKSQHDDEDFNFGAGVNTFLGSFLLKLDYAYSVYNILPDVHFISIGFEF